MERVVFIVDIDDSTAVRAKRQISSNVSSDEFCFLFPEEKNEYDPQNIIPLLDDSIIEDENFRDRVPENYYSHLNKQSFMGTINQALNEGLHILLYCRGDVHKERLLEWLDELSAQNGGIEVFQNHSFNPDYDDPKDIVVFEPYFEEIVQAFAENDLQIVLKNRAQ